MIMLRRSTMLLLGLALLGANAAGCSRSQAQTQAQAQTQTDQQPKVARAAVAKPGDPFPQGPYGDRDPALAKELVDAGALLLDVRTPDEFDGAHLEGAVNITHTAVAARVEEIRALQGGDLDRPIVLYCRSGRRADAAKRELEGAGFTRITNLGGMGDWPG